MPLQNHSQAIKFIKVNLLYVNYRQVHFGLSSTRTINCDAENDASGINSMNKFYKLFFRPGLKNPYDGDEDIVYTARNGSRYRWENDLMKPNVQVAQVKNKLLCG